MDEKDDFGYPVVIGADSRFVSPRELPASTPPDERVRHADAYSAYQERFRRAARARRRKADGGPGSA